MKFKIGEKEVDSESASFQQDLDAAVAAKVTAGIGEATTTLTTKNEQLLGELKTARKQIVPDEELSTLRATASKYETLKTEKMTGNKEYEKLLEESRTQHTQELAAQKAINDKLNSQLNTTLVSDSLSKALATVNVVPGLLNAATTMLSSKVAVIDQGDVRVALVGDKTIPDFIKDWAGTDEGKHFIGAPGNGGGGGEGDGSGGASATEFDKYFDPNNAEYNQTKQGELYNKDAKLYDQLDKKYENVQKKTT